MRQAMVWLLTILMLLAASAGALGEDYVSVSELHQQAQAMGGVWRQTFDTPNGEMTVDAPIIVPDVDAMPVITVERAKISEELFEQIRQGKKGGSADEHQYEIEMDGKLMEFFLGRDHDYVDGKQTDRTGYDAVSLLWIQRGGYRFSAGKGSMGSASPITYHYPWELDASQLYVRGSEQTIDDVMRIWEEDIKLCYPEEEYVIKPKRVELRGSTLMENTGTDKESKRNGYYKIWAEQYIYGFPLFGDIASQAGENHYGVNRGASAETNRASDKLNPYRIGAGATSNYLFAYSSNDEDNRTLTELDNVRSVEMADVPLASLQNVLTSIEKEIEAGHIRHVYSLRLGYLLYSNPGMDDYAWAVPRWVADCDYVIQDNEKDVEGFHEFFPELDIWSRWEFLQMPVDAQSAEPILFTIGDKQTFGVPEVLTWDDVK